MTSLKAFEEIFKGGVVKHSNTIDLGKQVVRDLKVSEVLKSKLELKSLALGIEDIFLKGTDIVVIYNEDESFELVKEWLKDE